MQESGLNAADHDVKTLIFDAKPTFDKATALAGEKNADAARRGTSLLAAAINNVQDAGTGVVVAGKEITASASNFVKDKPWHAAVAAAGAGMVLGVLFGRLQTEKHRLAPG